jgi:predicted DNA-binding transcriptional regulator
MIFWGLKLITEINNLSIYFIPIPNDIIYNILLEKISVARLQIISFLLEVFKRNVFFHISNFFLISDKVLY